MKAYVFGEFLRARLAETTDIVVVVVVWFAVSLAVATQMYDTLYPIPILRNARAIMPNRDLAIL